MTPTHGPTTAAHADGSSLTPDLCRLNKRLAEMGVCSRREADDWIARGWVKVNGQIAQMGVKVSAQDHIDIDRKAQGQQATQVTVLINKPMGYVSGQAEDGHQPAVALVQPGNRWQQDRSRHFFDRRQLRGLAPAGRLDIDSIGLLVLTQDGRVARQLIGDDSHMEKEYLVRVTYAGSGTQPSAAASKTELCEINEHDPVRHDVQSHFPAAQLELLCCGLSLDGQALRRAQVNWQNPEQLRFILTEGKKRQIRRMCELVGLKVVGLKRVRIGQVMLGNLPLGQWRYLGAHESF
jgi:23S rRNA pseudouridine2604 synthase